MYERFTGQARQVIVQAQEEARRLNHNYIGTEHLLLGLLATPDSLAGASLTGLGYTRADVESIIGRGQAPPPEHMPFTPGAKKVLELALREALHLNHNYIGTEHILLGLLGEGEGVAAQILIRKHPLGRIHAEVLEQVLSPQSRQPRDVSRTAAARDVLSLAQDLAGEATVGSQHILEAILQKSDSAAMKALAEAGVDLDLLMKKLDHVSTADTADDTPAHAAARHLQLSLSDDDVTVVLRDQRSIDLGKEILQLNGGPLATDGPQLDLLAHCGPP